MYDYWQTARGLSVAMFSFALYLFLLWARKRNRRKDLALAVVFVAMGLYDLLLARVSGSQLPEEAAPWLRFASASDGIVAAAFLFYLAEYKSLVGRRGLAVWTTVLVLLAAAELVAPANLVWNYTRASVDAVKLPFTHLIALYQIHAGPLTAAAAFAGLLFMGYCAVIVRRADASRRELKGFGYFFAAVAAAIANDALVAVGVYPFLYLTEYAWAGALVFLTYKSSNEVIEGSEAIQRLNLSEARLRAMVEHVPFNIWMCDAEGRIIMQNAADIATVGNHVGELYAQWQPGIGDPPLFTSLSRRALGGEAVDQSVSYEVAGIKRMYRDIIVPARSESAVIGSVGVGIDITEQYRAEEELKARLAEKEVLLREIHHRVKNNLQVVASLVNLQAENLEDPRAKEIFLSVQGQVDAIARVHESLYRSDNLATIDFGEYLRKLVDELFAMRGRSGISTALEIESLFLDVDSAIPCALVASELITNSIKHAFRGRESGRLLIAFAKAADGLAALAVEDDGPGIPEETTRAGASIGLVLVASLAKQLRGSVMILGPGRNRVELRFPI